MTPSSALCFANTPDGCMSHCGGQYLSRHCHREAFAALVLKGGYIEAGDRGRLHANAGDVVLHGPYESHLDHFADIGAQVLVLRCPITGEMPDLAHIDDLDFIVRMAERDPVEAAQHLLARLKPAVVTKQHWTDRLAADLRRDPGLSIHHWADKAGLRRESIGRGFRRAYGITPKAFRARTRTLQAVRLLQRPVALTEISFACGFADQAHMTRSIRALTGRTPRELRGAIT